MNAAASLRDAGVTLDHDVRTRLRRDVEVLTQFDRRTGGVGELASAHFLASRLREFDSQSIALTKFRTQTSWTPVQLAYVLSGIAVAAAPGYAARTIGALIAASYELDVSGRSQWLRRLLPSRDGVTVSARIPASGIAQRTVILMAHHDAAQTGLVWGPTATAASRYLSRHVGRAIPSHLPALAALVATAFPSARSRALGAAVLASSAALMTESMLSPTTPGANDNASGVATALEVARHFASDRLRDTDVVVVFTGGEEVGGVGSRAWLKENARHVNPDRTLVINLDAVGSQGRLAVAQHESLTGCISTRCVERVLESAAGLGLEVETLAIPNPTDAVAATQSGLPTVSLLSVHDGWISHLHRNSDTVDNVCWRTVESAVRLTERLVTDWAGEEPR